MKSIFNTFRSYINRRQSSTMSSMLSPPKHPGMTELCREKFKKIVRVPVIKVNEESFLSLNNVRKLVKQSMIKLEHFTPMRDGKVFLNPDKVSKWEDIPNYEQLEKMKIESSSLIFEDLELNYDNWKADEIIKAMMPDSVEPPSSYSIIGHIIHLNLRDDVLDYKKAVAEVFLDKIKICKTVINKVNSIDNEFRNFQLDLLAGEPNYQVGVKENGVAYEFDFSKVYWNPRLSAEHERIVKMLSSSPNQLVLDAFAGVGPFAVPLGKKKINVLANDLNPDSYKWLNHNVAKNKIGNFVKTLNKDAKDFIKEDIREILIMRAKDHENYVNQNIDIVMNLPALAVTFLKYFNGLLADNDSGITNLGSMPSPTCHCYCFVKGVDDPKAMAKQLVEQEIPISEGMVKNISFVRNVAPNKDMMRIDLVLTNELLFGKQTTSKRQNENETISTESKRICNDKNGNER